MKKQKIMKKEKIKQAEKKEKSPYICFMLDDSSFEKSRFIAKTFMSSRLKVYRLCLKSSHSIDSLYELAVKHDAERAVDESLDFSWMMQHKIIL